MSDQEKEPTQEPAKDWQAEIKKREDENFKAREKARQLEEELAALRPLAEKAKELEAAQMSEQEKAAAQLADLQVQIESAQKSANEAQRLADYQKLINQFDVDMDKHGTLLNAAMPTLDLSDAEKMAEILTPYAKQRAGQKAQPVINPASKAIPSVADLANLSTEDRLAAYEAQLKASH